MGNYEIQIQSSVFLAAQLAGLQARKTCPPAPLTIGGLSLVVHQIEFVTNALRHDKPASFQVYYETPDTTSGLTASGFRTQIAQDVVLHVGTRDDVLSNPNQPPQSVQPLPVTAVINLDYIVAVNTSQCFFRLTFDSLEVSPIVSSLLPPGVDADAVKSAVSDVISKVFPEIAQPLDFAHLLTPGSVKIENAGVSVSEDGDLLVFRAEVDPGSPSGVVPWSSFYHGSVTDQLLGAQWGFYAEKNMVQGFATNMVATAVSSKPIPGVTVTSIHSAYSNPGSKPHIETTIEADTSLLPGVSHIAVSLGLDVSVSQFGGLVINVTLPDLEAMAWDLLGAVRAMLLAVTGPLYAFVQAALLSLVAKAKFPADLGPACVMVDATHQVCTKSFTFPQFDGSVLRPRAAIGQPGGMVITGDLPAAVLTPSQLQVSFREFTWVLPQFSCGSADIAFAARFASEPASLAVVQAQIFLEHTGTTPAYLCQDQTKIINDPLGVFPASGLSWDTDQLPATLTLAVTNPGPAYAARPYPVDILVVTTLGQRLVRLAPAPVLTDDEIARLKALAVGAVANCELLTSPNFNMRWLVDPPPEREFVHLWQLGVENARPGEHLRLFDAAGQALASFNPQAGLTAWLSAVVGPAGANELSLVSSVAPEPGLATRISITQKLYETAGWIPLAAQAQRLFTTAAFPGQALAAVLDDAVTVLDMSGPAQPSYLGSWPVSGLRGAVDGPTGLIAFTGSQFYALRAGQAPTATGPAEPDPILAAAPADDGVFVLTPGQLQIRSEDLIPQQSLVSGGATTLLRLGSQLLAGGPSGLAVYPLLAGPALGPPSRSLQALSVLALEPAAGQGDGSVLATLTDGTARLLTIAEDGSAQETTAYPGRPWFAGGTFAGDALVIPDENGWSLRISVPGTEHTVGSDATDVVSPRLAFTDWTAIGENQAEGTLHGQPVTLTGVLGTGSVTDGTFPVYDSDAFSPRLPGADTVNIVAQGSRTFTVRFGAPVQDPVLQLASFASVFTFPPGTPVAKVSGDPTLTVTGSTASGLAAGSTDSNGTLRLYGLYTSLQFQAEPNFADGNIPDGIYLQIGALDVGQDDPMRSAAAPP